MCIHLVSFTFMSTDYVAALNVGLKSSSKPSESEIEDMMAEVRLLF